MKESFNNYLTIYNMKRKKCKEDALLLLDSIAYGRLNDDYVVAMEKLCIETPSMIHGLIDTFSNFILCRLYQPY